MRQTEFISKLLSDSKEKDKQIQRQFYGRAPYTVTPHARGWTLRCYNVGYFLDMVSKRAILSYDTGVSGRWQSLQAIHSVIYRLDCGAHHVIDNTIVNQHGFCPTQDNWDKWDALTPTKRQMLEEVRRYRGWRIDLTEYLGCTEGKIRELLLRTEKVYEATRKRFETIRAKAVLRGNR